MAQAQCEAVGGFTLTEALQTLDAGDGAPREGGLAVFLRDGARDYVQELRPHFFVFSFSLYILFFVMLLPVILQ